MKNYLLGWQTWETNFSGDSVSMELLPLNRSEFLRLLPKLDAFYKSSQEEKSGIQTAIEMSSVLEDVIPVVCSHIRNITGFTIDDQEPNVEAVLSASVFMTLVSDIVFRLVEISKISSGDEKNSEGQSTKAVSDA